MKDNSWKRLRVRPEEDKTFEYVKNREELFEWNRTDSWLLFWVVLVILGMIVGFFYFWKFIYEKGVL